MFGRVGSQRQSAQQGNEAVALSVAGQREPIEPVYQKNLSPSPISSQLNVPTEPTEWKAPVVYRGQRMTGMRYLYARGGVRQPISQLGTGPDIGIATWNSDFQPDQVSLHDAGFNDALFQAGYPGFNLGLSFKVPVLQESPTGPGHNMRMKSSNVTINVQKILSSVTSASSQG
jgi:hypothetical protein